jgi:hypothetical protein
MEQSNTGMMESWKNGEKIEGFETNIPLFQDSNIPFQT